MEISEEKPSHEDEAFPPTKTKAETSKSSTKHTYTTARWTRENLKLRDAAKLREICIAYDVRCTRGLVRAYNNGDRGSQSILDGWLDNYVQWFSDHGKGDIYENEYRSVIELLNLREFFKYSRTKSNPKSELVMRICDRAIQSEWLHPCLIEAVDCALSSVAPDFLKHHDIIQIGTKLCSMLDSDASIRDTHSEFN